MLGKNAWVKNSGKHAVQQITKAMSKRQFISYLCERMDQKIHNDDTGHYPALKSMLNTMDITKKCLSRSVLLRSHIERGCLSGIEGKL